MSNLTKEQKQQLAKVFRFEEAGELTTEEVARAKEMFSKVTDFNLLRKILGRYTTNERGISLAGKFENIVAENDSDYRRQGEIIIGVEEEIKARLLSFYQFIQGENATELEDKFKKENTEEIAEDKVREDLKEEKIEEEKKVGDNL